MSSFIDDDEFSSDDEATSCTEDVQKALSDVDNNIVLNDVQKSCLDAVFLQRQHVFATLPTGT